MKIKQLLLKPKELYTTQLEKQYHDAAEQYFDKLAKDAKTDSLANQQHVTEYNGLNEKAKLLEKSVNSTKTLKIFILVLSILSLVIGGLLLIIGFANPKWFFFVIGIFLLGLGIFLLVFNQKIIKKKQLEREAKLAEARKEAEAMLQLCYQDMASLNNSFDWNIPAAIMEKTTNMIDLDPYFSLPKYTYLQEKFGMNEVIEPNCSVLGVLSGNIQGNPFVLEKVMEEKLINKTYTGSITIHWTTTSYYKGKTVTHHHSETLTATIEKPAPNYNAQTVLVYGSETAPNLHFRREPSKINSFKNEKEKEKYVASEMKKIRKMEEKAVMEGGTFTAMNDEPFEVFFHALDRDNETEFRVLFTALAEENMMELLNDPVPYGDDFYMIKNGMINLICSHHSQRIDYSANPNLFIDYDFNASKNKFVSYCDEFIRGLYFDLAPILSIPDYQTNMPYEYIHNKEWKSNYSSFEQEALANGMDPNIFRPNGANPSLPLILKTTRSRKIGNSDCVNIHAYSYHTTEMVDYISKLGGDGHTHRIPVHWIKYDRVDSDNEIGISYVGSNRHDFLENCNNGKISGILGENALVHYERGLLAFKNRLPINDSLNNALEKLFGTQKQENAEENQ